MTYVAEFRHSAPGADITFSRRRQDVRRAPDELTVVENGATRKARADEYRHIRWIFKNSLRAGCLGASRASARF